MTEFPGNEIHPTAVVDPDVVMGRGNKVGPYAVILGPCTFGDDNWIGPSAVIGTPGEGHHYPREPGAGKGIVVGDRSTIREFVTVHQGVEGPTLIGNDCYIMARAHIPHDAVLEESVTVSDTVQIGGHSWIGAHANLGLSAVLHQWTRVGAWAMIGMQAAVTKDIPPGAMAVGVPARLVGANRVGLRRLGLSDDEIDRIDQVYKSGEVPSPVDLPSVLREQFAKFDEQASRMRRR